MKNSKKSLVASGLSLAVSCALLLGATFAWFTDSVTSTGNKIQAGNLKVALSELDEATGDFVSVDEEPIFNYNLWEPGYSDAAVLRVSNEGSLALKYQLNLVARGGDAGILGDVIDVYALVSEGTAITEVPDSLEDAIADGYTNVGTLSELMDDEDGAAYGVLYAAENTPAGGYSEAYAGIVLHMQETAGNEYQDETIGATFDIQLKATQYTYEKDGFGSENYDEGASFVWDAGVATDEEMAAITDEETKTVSIATGRQLAGLAAQVNAGNTYEGYTVELTDDIDLDNQPWTPIGVSDAPAGDWNNVTTYFAGTFDGNGYSISNLNVQSDAGNNVGFFGLAMLPEGATIENVVFDGATVQGKGQSVGVLAGAVTAAGHWVSGSGYEPTAVKDITVTGASVTGAKYVGGIIGYAQTSLQNVSVSESNVRSAFDADYTPNPDDNDSGENAGVVVGNLYDLFFIDGAKVRDSVVSGLSKLSAVAGSAHNADYIRNCTVTGVEMIIDGASSDDRFGWITGRAATINADKYTNNTVSGCVATQNGQTVSVEDVHWV